jgi:hypothetical protein
MVNCQLPERAEFCGEAWEELPPHAERNIMEANNNKANRSLMNLRHCTAGAS